MTLRDRVPAGGMAADVSGRADTRLYGTNVETDTGGATVTTEGAIFVGGGGEGYGLPQDLLLKYGNRHGLIAGATGTGKTVTLQTLAESFSEAGVPVFLSDVKGDLSGICQAGRRKASRPRPLPRVPRPSAGRCGRALSR
jgi:hypothetical protein